MRYRGGSTGSPADGVYERSARQVKGWSEWSPEEGRRSRTRVKGARAADGGVHPAPIAGLPPPASASQCLCLQRARRRHHPLCWERRPADWRRRNHRLAPPGHSPGETKHPPAWPPTDWAQPLFRGFISAHSEAAHWILTWLRALATLVFVHRTSCLGEENAGPLQGDIRGHWRIVLTLMHC